MLSELTAKRLQLLKESLPHLTRVAVLWNPSTPYHAQAVEDLKSVAPRLGMQLIFLAVQAPEQIVKNFSTASRINAQPCTCWMPLSSSPIERYFPSSRQSSSYRSWPGTRDSLKLAA
jgi:ABC-type uncharacterized transport system substrate-binding protein